MKKEPHINTKSLIDRVSTQAALSEVSGVFMLEDARDKNIMGLLDSMGDLTAATILNGNKTFTGLSHVITCNCDTPEAQRLVKFWDNAKTVLDVMVFFLTENGLDETVFTEDPDYDHDHVESYLYLPITEVKCFTLNSDPCSPPPIETLK